MIFKAPMVTRYESLLKSYSRSESGVMFRVWSVSEVMGRDKTWSWSESSTRLMYHSEENDGLQAGAEKGEGSGPLLCPLDYIL